MLPVFIYAFSVLFIKNSNNACSTVRFIKGQACVTKHKASVKHLRHIVCNFILPSVLKKLPVFVCMCTCEITQGLFFFPLLKLHKCMHITR